MIGAEDDLSFVPEGTAPAMRLTNPIAETASRLRRSILPGLLRAADLNQRRGVRNVRLFEIGHIFEGGGAGEFPDERARAALVWSGDALPVHWSTPPREVDIFDLMGVIEGLFSNLRLTESPARHPSAGLPALHPANSVHWTLSDGRRVAWGGALHPDLQKELAHPLFLAEVEIGQIGTRIGGVPSYSPVPRLTPVNRDLALVLTAEIRFREIRDSLAAVPAPVPVAFRAVDRYTGPPLAEGESSLTVRIVLQPSEKPLTDAQIDGYRLALIERLRDDLGVRIRG
jgi:phenylalanyl-tRNA synthetase beta chain